jgi:hypothetical protein
MRLIFAVAVGLLIVAPATFGQDKLDGAGENQDQPAKPALTDEARKELEAFVYIFTESEFDLPNVSDLKWVLYNTGKGWLWKDESEFEFRYIAGWVLSESPQEVRILRDNLSVHCYKREYSLPRKWYKYKNQHRKDKPLPGYYNELDFAQFCRNLMKEDWSRMVFDRYAVFCRSALYAYWSLQRNDEKTARDLLTFAKTLTDTLNKNIPEERRQGLLDSVNSTLATYMRYWVIKYANEGFPRSELVEQWKKLAMIPCNEYADGAREMVCLYQKLLADDKNWGEPKKEDFTKMTAEQQVTYWMYKLRETDAWQGKQPGSCDVIDDFCWADRPNPARELYDLGWAAVPRLIEHLDDPRPTRCVGFCRSHWHTTYYLLRYGDCCWQIFREITGIGYGWAGVDIIKNGKGAECKRKAQRWWEDCRKQGLEKYFFKLVEKRNYHPTRTQFAVEALLRINNAKYLPWLVELARGELAQGSRHQIFDTLAMHLGGEYQSFLKSLLDSESIPVVFEAAKGLWENFKDDSGVGKVIEQVKKEIPADPRGWGLDLYQYFAHSVIEFLAEVPKDYVVDAICAFLEHDSHEVRAETVVLAHNFPYRRVLEKLLPFLDNRDKAPTCHWTKREKQRYRDEAAISICKMVDYPMEFIEDTPEKDRDWFIEKLKTWLEKNKDNLDWESLGRRVEEMRKRRQPAASEAREYPESKAEADKFTRWLFFAAAVLAGVAVVLLLRRK